MKKSIDMAARTVTYIFDGELAPIVFHADKAPMASRNTAEMLAWANKHGDCAAISKSAENNFTVTEAMRHAEVLRSVNHHEGGGEWTMRAAKAAPQNPHIAAIAVKRGCSYEEAMEWFAAKLQAEMDADINA